MKIKKYIYGLCLILIFSLTFIDFVKADSYNNYSCEIVSCGTDTSLEASLQKPLIDKIPKTIPWITSMVYTAIQVSVPVLLIIFGMLDLMKAITAQKDDEIKKGQQLLIKRLISAALVFFVFVIIKVVVSIAADSNSSLIMKCTECFVKNNCEVRAC